MNALSSLATHGVVPSREESLAPEPSTSGAPIEERSGQAERRDRSSRARREPRGGAYGQASSRKPPSRIDPRWYQIAMLSALLCYGMWLGFGASLPFSAALIGAALATQWICSRLWHLPRFDPSSALISGIGLSTLLRTNGILLAMLAAALAIASKFVLRWRGKHLYNPTNLALAVMLLLGWGWISPGQYGQVAFAAMLIVCMGLLVVTRAARSDFTLSFLGVYGAILFGRSLWLGEPLAIPLHRLASGLLLQFAFNMISDPKTTPDSRGGRVLFGALVALGAGFLQFGLFRTNGPVWSLAALTPLVPLIDRLLPGARYHWTPSPPPVPSPAESHILQGVTP
jgi:Na+-transporting NADH:ubiquinone oxidoreductase subunit NqrB